eukprot:14686049-Alexandrium_andersonii.AAC.1
MWRYRRVWRETLLWQASHTTRAFRAARHGGSSIYYLRGGLHSFRGCLDCFPGCLPGGRGADWAFLGQRAMTVSVHCRSSLPAAHRAPERGTAPWPSPRGSPGHRARSAA